jgi:cell division protein FtsI (penicillin-binding protein 3)
MIVDEELEVARTNANARSAFALMINSRTGAILSTSQVPALNPNDVASNKSEALSNLVVESVYEPGSTFKPIVAAIAIDANVVRPTDVFNCENGHYTVGKHAVNDVHGYGDLSVHDIVVRSSNIGMTKIGMRLGKERLYQALRNFGFGERIELGLPGATPGIFRNVNGWATIDIATHSFGQGVAVTPMQLVRATAAIANGGVLPELHIVAREQLNPGRRVLSEHAALVTREMMYDVVEDEHGTGRKAALEGVRVGGKTGTAQKARQGGRGYESGKYIASFVGFVDASELGIDEMITLLVAIDEPNTTTIYGGTLAAPAFKKIAERTARVLATRKELKREGVPEPSATLPPEFVRVAYHTAA